ncbi:chromosome segregation protein SMC [Robinsoniella peoriensis]|uniref:Chromosome partition protein Smc n=1 Tax=Robinsoniella peoriensis TaxID=180332 RepID=A0A4U8Q7P9_9FIRM|nr:chromosome segregation protein SMC [Robinsoniella peoriensis]TLD00539.1 Chromosome partition protein Smc [Robinsoniella peoriensis]
MYLKSIEIHGFKSFANKIVFKFHNGITGIVGPNGSGKSNVGDAVRWVLGEQRAKQLRGASMQDVIFSGTENRKPMGFASVAITLDNEDHQLPIDYNEVTVTRRVYRSGESEYLINGTTCRLKDVNELFYDTGIGKEGYSIIGQGQIDKILSGKPEERRELFDEAVGIVKYKRRKLAAQKKLEDEKQNLVRVNDILSELTKQLGPLQRQAETAKIYLKKKEELKTVDANMFLMEMDRIKAQLREIEEKISISNQDLQSTKANYESAKVEYERIEKEMEELSAKIEEEKERSNKNQLLKQQLAGQINVLKEQINTAKLNGEHLQNRILSIQKELDGKTQQKDSQQTELGLLKEQLDKFQAVEVENKAVGLKLQENTGILESHIEEGKNQIIDLLNKRASTKAKLQRYSTMIEQIQIRKAELSQKILKLKSEESEQEESLAAYQKDYMEVSARIDALSEESTKYDNEVTELQQILSQQNEQMETGQTAYHREASRLESLKNITERYDGYGNSIRRVMEQKNRETGIMGVVADIIKVQKSYETAIETALGGSIQNIVTQDEHTAKRMIDFLKRGKYGRATFLPLTSIGNRNGFTNEKALKEPGVIGLASSLVDVESCYEGLAKYLLGRTVVVDHIDNAIIIAKKYQHTLRIVTLDGESLSPGGSMTGGAFKNSSNLLGRRREIEELTESVALLKNDMEELQKSIDVNRDKRRILRNKIVELKDSLQKEYIVQNTAKMKIKQMQSRNTETKSGYAQLKRESSEIEAQIADIRIEESEIQKDLEESVSLEKKTESLILGLQKELEVKKQEQDAHNSKSEGIHLDLANLKQKEEFIHQNISRINHEMKSLQEERESIKNDILENEKDIQKKAHDIREIEISIAKASEHEGESNGQVKEWMEKKDSLYTSHKSFFAKREELSERMAMLDKENFRLASQLEKLEESKETQINYMWEEYELTVSTAHEFKDVSYENQGQLKKAIQILKSDIKGLGSVNVNAIEDFKELSERHEFLSTQHDDLIKAEEILLGIIEELDSGMRAQFKENFAIIQAEFDKAFKQLFGGGKGSLELVEDEDILEAGIRIISQPPGKKLQNMMQLSGGEKALTAIALLFAIQKLKPSPFCLLDEIEAALDESNVTRYAKYLNKLTTNTQFIIITHRRGTMEVADRLYGITMQEKGVSALVSVNLIEDELDK